MIKEIITHSPDETERVGAMLAGLLGTSGEKAFVMLFGDLGAGKTAFTRGFASILSPGARVKSPTYTIVNEYRTGKVPLFHFDLYRISDADELEGIGFYEYTEKGHCILEWSENLGGEEPDGAVRVRIEKLDGDDRRITMEIPDKAEGKR